MDSARNLDNGTRYSRRNAYQSTIQTGGSIGLDVSTDYAMPVIKTPNNFVKASESIDKLKRVRNIIMKNDAAPLKVKFERFGANFD